MLTPQERAVLARLEQQLLLEDPAFAARLRRARPPRMRPSSATLLALSLISVAAALTVLLIVQIALLLGHSVPVPPVVGLSLLCLVSGLGCALLHIRPGPDRL